MLSIVSIEPLHLQMKFFNAGTFLWINISMHLEKKLPKKPSGFPSIDVSLRHFSLVKSANADREKAIEMRQQAMETMAENEKRQAETDEEVKDK